LLLFFSAIFHPYRSPGYVVNKEVAFVSEIHDDRTILSNIGFPNHYTTNQAYKWIITYPENHYIKLVFTHIELNIPQVSDMETLKM
jgi:hypothetical protein